MAKTDHLNATTKLFKSLIQPIYKSEKKNALNVQKKNIV